MLSLGDSIELHLRFLCYDWFAMKPEFRKISDPWEVTQDRLPDPVEEPDNWYEEEARSITKCCNAYMITTVNGDVVCRACRKIIE